MSVVRHAQANLNLSVVAGGGLNVPVARKDVESRLECRFFNQEFLQKRLFDYFRFVRCI